MSVECRYMLPSDRLLWVAECWLLAAPTAVMELAAMIRELKMWTGLLPQLFPKVLFLQGHYIAISNTLFRQQGLNYQVIPLCTESWYKQGLNYQMIPLCTESWYKLGAVILDREYMLLEVLPSLW